MRLRKEEREAMGYNKPRQTTTVHKIIVRRPDIEKGIPLPRWTKPTVYDYPYEQMEIGDSFRIWHTEASNEIVSSRVHSWMRGPKNIKHLRFACRKGKDPDGQTYTRVWRVEPDPDLAMMENEVNNTLKGETS